MAKKKRKSVHRDSTQYEQLASEYVIKATPFAGRCSYAGSQSVQPCAL